MKLYGAGVVVVLALLAFSGEIRPQEPPGKTPSIDTSCDVGPEKSGDKWYRVSLRMISVCLPPELKRVEIKCFDGGCYRFESDIYSLRVDLDPAAGRPTFERDLPSYREKLTTIDGRDAWIWYFEDIRKYKGLSGVNFKMKGERKYSMGVYFSSTEPGKHELATRIFESIRFLSNPHTGTTSVVR